MTEDRKANLKLLARLKLENAAEAYATTQSNRLPVPEIAKQFVDRALLIEQKYAEFAAEIDRQIDEHFSQRGNQ